MAKMKEKEAQEGELTCGICQVSVYLDWYNMSQDSRLPVNTIKTSTQVASSTAALLLESCLSKQKAAIFGTNRGFSCDFCDVHLSEKEWLDNHNQGEKHRWVSERVKLLLPVQWIQPPPKTVPRGPNVPPELVCVVCQQGFWPLEKYRWEKFI